MVGGTPAMSGLAPKIFSHGRCFSPTIKTILYERKL
jgi:hypothetical protein